MEKQVGIIEWQCQIEIRGLSYKLLKDKRTETTSKREERKEPGQESARPFKEMFGVNVSILVIK